jgi:integrase
MSKQRKEIPDGVISGGYEVIQPSGAKSCAFRYSYHGRKRKYTFPWLPVKERRLRFMKLKVEVANGGDPAGEKQAARRAAKFPDHDVIATVVAQFLKRQAPSYKANTLCEVTRVMRREILPGWGARRLSSITKPEVHDWLDGIVDRPAPIAANRALAWFKRLCSWAIERGLIEKNPCAGIKLPSAETARSRILANGEFASLWLAADALPSPDREYVQLLILSGQRRTEVSAITWSEIDLERKIWVLPAVRAKNSTEHEVPLSELACEILRGIPRIDGCDFVFSVNGRGPISTHYLIKKRLDRLMPPMPPWTLHDIRRTVATGLAELGTQLPVIEKLLNHTGGSLRGIVGTYQRFDFREQKRIAMEAWARRVETLVTGETANVVPLHQKVEA